LDSNYRLSPGSPAIDTGTALFTQDSIIVLDLQPYEYYGAAPDLGAFEIYQLIFPLIFEQGKG
jgi:hypothetical protein